MQRVSRLRFFIIAAIACAVLFCIAAFSVSFAEWTGDDSANAEVGGKAGLFYVEYPQYAETEEIKLNPNKYYIQVKQTDNSGATTGYAYYPMSENGTAADGRKQYNVELGLDENQSVYLYKGNTAITDVKKDSSWTTAGTLSNGKFTATSSGIFDFYFKEGGDEVSTELTYPYTVKLELTCSGNKTYSMYFDIPEENLSKVYLWLWSSSTNYSGGKWPGVSFAEIKSKSYSSYVSTANLFKVSGVKAENLSFILSYNNTDPRPSSGNPAKQTDTIKFSNVFSEGDNYKTITASGSSITITDTPATGGEVAPTTNALYVDYTSTGTATPPTPVVQPTSTSYPKLDVRANKTTIEKNAAGRFVYHNYICVSRKNHVGDDDNSMAYVELSLDDCSVNPYLLIVKSLKITRKATNANGVPNGGFIDPAPRIYNYDETEETRLGPDPSHTEPDPNGDENRYPILTHGNKHDVSEGLDGEAADNHMVDHYDDGAYIVLFFADRDQQYFALDIEIVLELDKENVENAADINTLEFTLVATANNINEWQRYEDGYGMPWGFYMGGLINDVWLWDPRRTTQMDVASGSVKLDDPATYKTINYNDGKGDVEYPAGLVDLSLTVNLIKGSTIKMYMIDNEGHRLNGNTIYLMAHAIEYDTETKKLFVDNPDYPIYDEDLNIVIPKTGSYMFRLVGHVRTGDETLDGMSGKWFRLHDGECLKQSEVNVDGDGNATDKETGSVCLGLPAYNLIVDRLYITSSEGKSTCEITLNANGGTFTENNAETVKRSVMFGSNIKVSKFPTPTTTQENVTFAGWYTDAACTTAFVNNTPATGDMTLYAKWAGAEYDITFVGNGGKWGTNSSKTVKTGSDGKIATDKLPDKPTYSGYTFGGWKYNDGTVITHDSLSSTIFSADTTLTAQWTINEYTITIITTGGGLPSGVTVSADNVTHGGTIELNVTGLPDEHSHVELYTDNGRNTAFAMNTAITSNRTLYAKYYRDNAVYVDGVWKQALEEHKDSEVKAAGVRLDTALSTVTFWYGKSERNVSVKGDCHFKSDYDGAGLKKGVYDFYYDYDSNDLWIESYYIITFDANGGTLTSAAEAITGKNDNGTGYATLASSAIPSDPTPQAGYSFKGWFTASTGGEQVTLSTSYNFTESITLYAQWRDTSAGFTVAFDSRGGTPVSSQMVAEGGKATVPNAPTKSGSVFLGWYEDEACSMLKDYDFNKAVDSDKTLYAKWTSSSLTTGYYFVGEVNGWTPQAEYYIGSNGFIVINITTADNDNERFKIAERNSSGGLQNWIGQSEISVGSEHNSGGDDIKLNKAGKYTICFNGSKIQIYYYENGSYGGGGESDIRYEIKIHGTWGNGGEASMTDRTVATVTGSGTHNLSFEIDKGTSGTRFNIISTNLSTNTSYTGGWSVTTNGNDDNIYNYGGADLWTGTKYGGICNFTIIIDDDGKITSITINSWS